MKRSMRTVVVMIAAILLSGFGQAYLRGEKAKLGNTSVRKDQIAGMDSMAVGLVLGGLRGPLVMALWTSSESQKMDQDLRSIDTKIELIRILQPNFDSVHIFQLWNKAYNLSAQMTSAKDRYAMILDALEYGRRIDETRPDNINILSSVARIYLDKFCTFEDRAYFEQRVRDESRAAEETVVADKTLITPQRFPILLDKEGRVLPELLKPAKGVKIGPYNGATLQYLERYSENGGFPYGVPPSALAYNYYRRSVDLLKYGNQKHAELSDAVLETRDNYCLYNWAQDESFHSLRLEAEVFGKTPRIDLKELQASSQSVKPGDPIAIDKTVAAKRLKEALFSYWRSIQIAQDAVKDFQLGIDQNPFGDKLYGFLQHQDDCKVIIRNCTADRLYLQLIVSDAGIEPLPENTARAKIIEQAMESYKLCINEAYRVMLQYYVDQNIATTAYVKVLGVKPARTTGRWTLDNVNPEYFPRMKAEYDAEMQRTKTFNIHSEDVADYESYIARAKERIAILKSLQ